MTQRRNTLLLDLAIGFVSGLLATKITNLVQNPLRRLTPKRVSRYERRVFPIRSSSLAAAEKLAPFLPIAPTPGTKEAFGKAIHFATGMAWGPTYVLLRRHTGWHPLAAAAASGTAMSLILDEGLVPQLGLSAPNRAYPVPTHLRGLAAHLVFGTALALAVESIGLLARFSVAGLARSRFRLPRPQTGNQSLGHLRCQGVNHLGVHLSIKSRVDHKQGEPVNE